MRIDRIHRDLDELTDRDRAIVEDMIRVLKQRNVRGAVILDRIELADIRGTEAHGTQAP
jgi:hypothetical protein